MNLTKSGTNFTVKILKKIIFGHDNSRLYSFVLWRFQVLPAVRAHGFEGILEGTIHIPTLFIETVVDPSQTPIRQPNPEFLETDKVRSIPHELGNLLHLRIDARTCQSLSKLIRGLVHNRATQLDLKKS